MESSKKPMGVKSPKSGVFVLALDCQRVRAFPTSQSGVPDLDNADAAHDDCTADMPDGGRREDLCCELDCVGSEIDDGLVSFASPEAKREWMAFRPRSRALADAATIVDADLVVVVQKAKRFRAILRALKLLRDSKGNDPARTPQR